MKDRKPPGSSPEAYCSRNVCSPLMLDLGWDQDLHARFGDADTPAGAVTVGT
jgi:hypothetical protein